MRKSQISFPAILVYSITVLIYFACLKPLSIYLLAYVKLTLSEWFSRKIRHRFLLSIPTPQIGAEIKKEPADKGERPRASQNAYSEWRPGTFEDGPADFSRGHEAHEDWDAPFRAQLHLGTVADPGQLWRRWDHGECRQRHRQHQRERQHDHLVIRKLRGGGPEEARAATYRGLSVSTSGAIRRAGMAGVRLLQRSERESADAVPALLRSEDVPDPTSSASAAAALSSSYASSQHVSVSLDIDEVQINSNSLKKSISSASIIPLIQLSSSLSFCLCCNRCYQ